MKIIQLISSLEIGGAEKLVVDLTNELAIKNEVLLCVFKPITNSVSFYELIKPSIKCISLNKQRRFDLKIYKQLYKLFKDEKPNVIHFHLDATLKYVLPLVVLFPEIKFIYTIHSDLNKEKQVIFNLLSKFNFLLKKVKFVCIASTIIRDFEANYKNLKFHLIENGIAPLTAMQSITDALTEINTLKFNADTLVFMAVGRLDENKNQELLIQTFNSLIHLNIICIIIGKDPSPTQSYFNKLASIKSTNTFLLGPKTNITNYLLHADAFIISSINEGLPISALEALSLGLPIISTPAGGLKSLIKNTVNGFLAKDGSVNEITLAIKSFLELKKSEREKINENNKHYFSSSFDIKVCLEKYMTLYN